MQQSMPINMQPIAFYPMQPIMFMPPMMMAPQPQNIQSATAGYFFPFPNNGNNNANNN